MKKSGGGKHNWGAEGTEVAAEPVEPAEVGAATIYTYRLHGSHTLHGACWSVGAFVDLSYIQPVEETEEARERREEREKEEKHLTLEEWQVWTLPYLLPA
jgi:hypothetical protein